MRTMFILVLILAAPSVWAQESEVREFPLETGVELHIKEIPFSRILPTAYYDQAMASIPGVYPGSEIVAKRRYGRFGTDLAAIIHKFGVSVDFLRKFRAESVFRCDYKASKLVEPNRDEARAPSGNSSARRGLYICVGAGSQGTVRWDTDGASVMRRAFVRDKTMPGAPRCDEKFPEPGHRF